MCLMANSASVSNLMFFRLLIIYKCLFYFQFVIVKNYASTEKVQKNEPIHFNKK